MSVTGDTYVAEKATTLFKMGLSPWHGCTVPDLDRAISLLARIQHGAFSHGQVVARGGTKQQIFYRVSLGDWLALDRGVYALASAPATWRRQVMAAVLSKNRAIATGITAGALHNIPGCRRIRPEITVPYTGSAASAIAVIRRRSDFTAIEAVTVDRIPASSVAETLFDLGQPDAAGWRSSGRPRCRVKMSVACVCSHSQ